MACDKRNLPHNLSTPRFIPFLTILLGLLSFYRKCGPVSWSSLDNNIINNIFYTCLTPSRQCINPP
jgi:hypothetical protein